MNKYRNSGLDLFRCVLTYGICVYHAFFLGGGNGFESRIWTWCVPGFAMLSGYYGVRFSFKKIIHLWSIAAICNLFPVILCSCNAKYVREGCGYISYIHGNWYLMAYTILILFSPMINSWLKYMHLTKDYKGLVGIGVIAVWSWFSEQWGTRNYVPRVAGLGALSFSSILVAYVVAWCYKEFNWRHYVKWWWAIPLMPMMSLFGHYDSPVTLIFVLVLFSIFERVVLSPKFAMLVFYMGSAGFAVYTLHANWPVIGLMRDAINAAISQWQMPQYASFLSVAFIMYIGGVALYLLVSVPLMYLRRWKLFQK